MSERGSGIPRLEAFSLSVQLDTKRFLMLERKI